ncbi:Aspartate-semialdehyde dehydrogenase [Chlamydiales bacterium STE3]|nr:Aspartate-semialdehyde dehydrogenase [Chlamydiales bacterium STE3]
MKKIPVGLLGATGVVGQQYLQLLQTHPWFEITFLAASEQSAGKSYQEATLGKWRRPAKIPPRFANKIVHSLNNLKVASEQCAFVFSAMNNDGAKNYEEKYAEAGIPVISNASYHRLSADIPMLIPEINAHHAHIIPLQQKNRRWEKGFIAVKPNCSIQSYMIPLAALHKEFVIFKVLITTMQAISGAGHPGVASLDITDNVIPYIAQEEGKSEQEPLKIFGEIKNGHIVSNQHMQFSAHCNRVPVIDGHLACINVEFKKRPSQQEILKAWQLFEAEPQHLQLPSAPLKAVNYLEEENRPQPRLDRDFDKGMAITVGRLRPCPIFDYKFVALSHNTLRGAAGGGILNAELLMKMGYLAA